MNDIDAYEREPARADDRGIGIIEAVIAMFIIAIIALAFLPVLASSMRATASNVTTTAASQLASNLVEQARGRGTSCSAVRTWVNSTHAAVVDARGATLTPTMTVASCPSTYPGTVRVSVSVTRSDTGATAGTAVTLIYVDAA